jgi:hypothetical protein
LNDLQVIKTWKTDAMGDNFPMALDTANNQVLIGYRKPAMLVVYDITTGKEVSRTDIVGDTDDVFYYEANKEVIVSGGEGAINILKKDSGNTYKQVANISTRVGARTALVIRPLKTYVVAERANMGKDATIAVYSIQDSNTR